MNAIATHPIHRIAPIASTAARLVLGGVCIAIVDLGFAMAYWALQDVPSIRILQSIAAWAIGRDAFTGGWASALFGASLYAQLMVGLVLAYHLASRRYGVLLRRPLTCGALYGVAMYLLIFQIMVPYFSAAIVQPEPLAWRIVCVVTYTVLIGIPCAKLAQWADRRRWRQADWLLSIRTKRDSPWRSDRRQLHAPSAR